MSVMVPHLKPQHSMIYIGQEGEILTLVPEESENYEIGFKGVISNVQLGTQWLSIMKLKI